MHLEGVSTGWVSAGVVEGNNKVVPLVSFTLKNGSDQKLRALQVNAVFRRGLSLGVSDGSSSIRLYRTDVVNALPLEATDYDILQEMLVRTYAAERFLRELRVDRIWEGTSEIQRLIVTRSLERRGVRAVIA